LNLGKVRLSHLRRSNGGTYKKFANSYLESNGKQLLWQRDPFWKFGCDEVARNVFPSLRIRWQCWSDSVRDIDRVTGASQFLGLARSRGRRREAQQFADGIEIRANSRLVRAFDGMALPIQEQGLYDLSRCLSCASQMQHALAFRLCRVRRLPLLVRSDCSLKNRLCPLGHGAQIAQTHNSSPFLMKQ
jgi:hypothetical protein